MLLSVPFVSLYSTSSSHREILKIPNENIITSNTKFNPLLEYRLKGLMWSQSGPRLDGYGSIIRLHYFFKWIRLKIISRAASNIVENDDFRILLRLLTDFASWMKFSDRYKNSFSQLWVLVSKFFNNFDTFESQFLNVLKPKTNRTLVV